MESVYYSIDIQGKGGHSSQPFKTVNPLIVGANLIRSLQEAVWYGFDSFERVGLEVVSFNAGERGNVIPETGRLVLKADFRDDRQKLLLREKIENGVKSVQELWKISCQVTEREIINM